MVTKVLGIEKVKVHASNILAGKTKVKPGNPAAFSEASTLGDVIAQGDVNITLTNKNIKGYTKHSLVGSEMKLVPGPDDGAKHFLVLQKGDSVEVYVPNNWNETSFIGPKIVVKSGNPQIVHRGSGKHGTVTLTKIDNKNTCYGITYQRVFSVVEKEARRARD